MTPSTGTAFVTGATGLLGSNLVRELLGRGFGVRALARDAERAGRLLPDAPGLQIVPGDMADVPAFAAALAGSDVVFHAAAYFRESYRGGSHWQKLHAVNVDGTRALVEASYERGVRRFLHVSSVGTLVAHAPDGRPVDETLRRDPTSTRNDYFRSKILADRVVDEALDRHPDLWAAFILPGFMNGPGDAGPTAAGQTILDFAARKLPGVVDVHLSYVDARDVAQACVEAVERAPRGERYVVAGRRTHLGDAYRLLERTLGVPAPTRRVPLALLAVVAAMNELWARISGRPVLIGTAMFRTLREEGPYNSYDSSKAERALGVRFRPLETTLRDAAAWLSESGTLVSAMRATSAHPPASRSARVSG
jgi:nucleoside-diphosphate-sugar epimerase